MSYIDWTATYSVGIDSIDQQHKRLVDIINELYDGMKQGKGQQVLNRTFTELASYTQTHFKYEEDVFDKYGYMRSMSHKKEHTELLKQVALYAEQYQNGKIMMSMEVMDFLKNWLLNHILVIDKAYTDFFKEHNVK